MSINAFFAPFVAASAPPARTCVYLVGGGDFDAAQATVIARSVEGSVWSQINITALGLSDSVIGFDTDGTIIVAITDGGNLLWSDDKGLTWHKAISPFNDALGTPGKPLAFGNGTFVALGSADGGTTFSIARSTDGKIWTAGTLDGTAGASQLGAVGFGNGRFLVGGSGTTAVQYSDDNGLTFTKTASGFDGTSGFSQGVAGFAYGNGTWGAFGNDATNNSFAQKSATGIGWSTVTTHMNDGGSGTGFSIAFGAGVFVIVGLNGVASDAEFETSPDMTTWTIRELFGTAPDLPYQVSFGGGLFVAAGQQPPSVSNGRIRISSDGIDWDTPTITFTQDNNAFLSGAFGFCEGPSTPLWIAGMSIAEVPFVATSTDGQNWNLSPSTEFAVSLGGPWGLAFGNDLFIGAVLTPGGDFFDEGIFVSTVGLVWTGAYTDDNLDSGFSAAYGNGIYVVGGQNGNTSHGSIMTATDPLAAPTFGSELIVDGDLATDPALSGWVLSASSVWSAGQIVTTSVGGDDTIQIPMPIVASHGYKVVINFTITGDIEQTSSTNVLSPSGPFALSSGPQQIIEFGSDFTGTDTLILDFKNDNPGAVRTITSVSVKEHISAWTLCTLDAGFDSTSGTVYGLAYGNGVFVAGGLGRPAGSTIGIIETSSNGGVTWIDRANGFNPTFAQVTCVGFGNNIFLAGGQDSIGALLQTSTDDGVTWNTEAGCFTGQEAIQAVAYGNGMYVAGGVGNDGFARIESSPDTVNWTVRTQGFGTTAIVGGFPFTSLVYGMTFASGLFIAIGNDQNGAVHIESSPDGITWTPGTLNFTNPGGNPQSLGICVTGNNE